MKFLKLFLIAVGIIVLLLVLAFVALGIALPAGASYENEVEINASAEKVWNVVTDIRRYGEWQTQLERVEIIDDKNWVEYPKNSPQPLRFLMANDERPRKMEFHYTMGDTYAGHWKGEITQVASGVRLTTSDSYTTDGWMTKVLIYLFFDLESFAKDWNNKLKERVESLNK